MPVLDAAGGVAALAGEGPPAGVPGTCAMVWVEGPDAQGYLQGLLSNDVAALTPGEAVHALLLDVHGHIEVALRVHRDAPDGFTLVAPPEAGEGLMATLERYHFSEDLELLGPEPGDLLTVPAALADGAPWPAVPGVVPGTVDLLVDDPRTALDALGAAEAPARALLALRIERGAALPGVDTGPRTLVQEAALETVAVSFAKGCYLGQETVARAQHRGRVQRTLRGLAAPAPLPVGAEVRLGDRVVGTVTSAAHSPRLGEVGLAILRREAEPGAEVAVAGVEAPVTVVELPFR
jgi:folate-binding protein YgfZ